MILSGNSFKQEIELGNIVISPFHEKYVNPNSYDLHLGKSLYRLDDEEVDPLKDHKWFEFNLLERDTIIQPGKLYLAHTIEVAGSTVYIPKIEGKSTLARLGLSIHLTAGYGDIGFIGSWTLEITTVKPFILRYGMPICQIEFDVIKGDKHIFYNGKYNSQTGVGLPQKRTDWIFLLDEEDEEIKNIKNELKKYNTSPEQTEKIIDYISSKPNIKRNFIKILNDVNKYINPDNKLNLKVEIYQDYEYPEYKYIDIIFEIKKRDDYVTLWKYYTERISKYYDDKKDLFDNLEDMINISVE